MFEKEKKNIWNELWKDIKNFLNKTENWYEIKTDKDNIKIHKISETIEYMWKNIKIKYLSWTLLFNNNFKKIYLINNENNNLKPSSWFPEKEKYLNIFYNDKGKDKIDLWKVEENAVYFTKKEIWIDIIKNYQDKNISQWFLEEEYINWKKEFVLILVIFFIIKRYNWFLKNWNFFEVKNLNKLNLDKKYLNPINSFFQHLYT